MASRFARTCLLLAAIIRGVRWSIEAEQREREAERLRKQSREAQDRRDEEKPDA